MPDPRARSGESSLARQIPFEFKVTWSCLYAHFPPASRNRTLQKRTAATEPWNRTLAKTGAAWSMVVPKMSSAPPARKRVLEIAPPPPKAKETVGLKTVPAFFRSAIALAACLALLLIQSLPKQPVAISTPPAPSPVVPKPPQPALVPGAPVKPLDPAARLVAKKTPARTHPNVESAPVITEPSEPPAPSAPITAPAAYRPEPAPEPRFSEGFESSRVLKKVKPVYPEPAASARIEGTVRLKAFIGKNGTVENVVPESGPPMLFEAASNAVRQWIFLPARLNGDAVEDVIHINISFGIAKPEASSNP